MAQYYYLNAQNQQCGPVDESMLLSNGVTDTTMVWTAGMANWMPVGQVPELQRFFLSTPYPNPNMGPTQPSIQYPTSYPSSNPIPNQNPFPTMSKPDSNLIWAILATLLCCWPMGIYAIVCATKVDKLYNSGDYAGAQQASDDAKKWAMYSAIAGIVIFIIAFISGLAGN